MAKKINRWLDPRIERLLDIVLDAAKETEKPYAVGGALAMGAHGYRRHTEDIDVFIIHADRTEWIRSLRGLGLEVRPLFAGVQYEATLPGDSSFHIDLLLPAEDPDLSAIEAPEEGEIVSRVVDVWPVTLLVIAKFRSKREKDQADVKEMYERGMFDPAEVRTIMRHMGEKILAHRFWLKYGKSR